MARIYIDAGHGGSDSGAVRYLVEKTVNLKIALACDEYLRAKGIETMMARTTDVTKNLATRTSEANKYKADYYVSIHNNAGEGDGAEMYFSIYRGVGEDLAHNILDEIAKIGQNIDRGCKMKKASSGKDYYAVIRNTNMPSVIAECVFVDNAKDAQILDTDAECKAMGVAIAKGVIKTLIAQGKYKEPALQYKTHVQSIGWMDWVKAGKTAGTTGQAKRMEAIIIDAPTDWDIQYQVHCQRIGDMPLVKDGEIAGTVGQGLRMESIRILANKKIMYRVHQQGIGWTKWYTNGEWAGVKGQSKRMEAIEIKEA